MTEDRAELIRFWRTFPAPSNEVAAAEIIEELELKLTAAETKLAARRPFSDKLAQEVIDGQVKEIDRLTKLVQQERARR